MKRYDYYKDVKRDAVFTEEKCQFCGNDSDCLEGVYFGQSKLNSICLDCLDNHRIEVYIPEYLRNQIQYNCERKTEKLKYTPPVPWVQYNEWQICCDDYMQYIGEWEQEDFIKESVDGDGIGLLQKLLCQDTLDKVDDINVLWEDIGFDTVAFVFYCPICNRKKVVCQSY